MVKAISCMCKIMKVFVLFIKGKREQICVRTKYQVDP